jgi:trk system potassium uptake protein TrkH
MLERRAETRRPGGFTAPSRRLPSTVAHISGLALLVVAPGLFISAIVEFIGGGGAGWILIFCSLVFGVLGGMMWSGTRLGDLAIRTVFASVAWSWLLVSVLGALPFVLARTFERDGVSRWIELADAIFESVSGYTCTGSTVLTVLPDLGEPDPAVGKGILFYRQLTQWYGGMGFVQLVITVLPALGSKALGFMGAEAPGPTSDRLAPRAADTAKILWKLYVGGTVVIALAYTAAGMSPYDGFAHALSTAATGGFSTYNDSLGEFDSVPIEIVAQVSMLFGGSNWALHWLFLTKSRKVYAQDHEFRAYIAIYVLATIAITAILTAGSEVSGGLGGALRVASFNAASLASSTGFGNAQGPGTAGDIVLWSATPLAILLLLMVVGGMSGSTAGGTKVIRSRVLAAISHRTLAVARQPRAVVPVKLGGDVVSERVVHQVSLFMMAYSALVVGGFLAVTWLGGDTEAAISGVIGSLGNMGPAYGDAGPTSTFHAGFPTPARLVLAFLMLVGRLEIFAVLLMFAAPRRSLRQIKPHKKSF